MLVGIRLYQNVYARMAPLLTGWRQGWLSLLAFFAALWMRVLPLFNGVLVLVPTLIDSDLWPQATIVGQLGSWMGVSMCTAFMLVALKRARGFGLSTLPPSDLRITGLSKHASWVQSGLFYAIAVCTIGTLIIVGRLQDVWLYASAVGAINFGLFFLIKCGTDGPDLRVSLHRAIFAAERMRRVAAANANGSRV